MRTVVGRTSAIRTNIERILRDGHFTAGGIVNGSGGGKPDIAQAGGKDATKLPEALQRANDLGRELLGK